MSRRAKKSLPEDTDDKKIDRASACTEIDRLVTSLSQEQAKLVFAIIRPHINDNDITRKGKEVFIAFDLLSDSILAEITAKIKEFVSAK